MCAGAVHTPHLLQLSGVGDGEELRSHGIDVKAELPGVGKNLQDHPAAVTGWTCPEEFQGISVTDELIDKRGRVRLTAALNYLLRGKGPLATTGCDHGALVCTRGASHSLRLSLRSGPQIVRGTSRRTTATMVSPVGMLSCRRSQARPADEVCAGRARDRGRHQRLRRLLQNQGRRRLLAQRLGPAAAEHPAQVRSYSSAFY